MTGWLLGCLLHCYNDHDVLRDSAPPPDGLFNQTDYQPHPTKLGGGHHQVAIVGAVGAMLQHDENRTKYNPILKNKKKGGEFLCFVLHSVLYLRTTNAKNSVVRFCLL